MNIPNFQNIKIVGSDGYLTDSYQNILQQLFTELQKNVGTEGFKIPDISSDPLSVSPPTTGGQLARVQNSFGQQNGVLAGTIIFDPYEANGGSPRNGQLKVMLRDGTFHSITNT